MIVEINCAEKLPYVSYLDTQQHIKMEYDIEERKKRKMRIIDISNYQR
jgi:hypothetical protein